MDHDPSLAASRIVRRGQWWLNRTTPAPSNSSSHALELPYDQRPAFLREACGGDLKAVRIEVETLARTSSVRDHSDRCEMPATWEMTTKAANDHRGCGRRLGIARKKLRDLLRSRLRAVVTCALYRVSPSLCSVIDLHPSAYCRTRHPSTQPPAHGGLFSVILTSRV